MAQYLVGLTVKNRGFEESKMSLESINNNKKIKKSSPDN